MKNIQYNPLKTIALLLVFSIKIYAQSGQDTAIMEAVKAETDAYYAADAKKYETTWLKSDKISQTFIAKSSYSTKVGWENIVPDMVKYLGYMKPQKRVNKYENINIKADKNLAFVEYDMTQTIPNNPIYKRISHEYRVLVKEKERWLLFTQITNDTETFKELANNASKLPEGWFKTGDTPTNYNMKLEKDNGFENTNCLSLTSIDNTVEGFGSIGQDSSPSKYLGKRIRMTAYLKSKELSEWAGLWLRIDTKTPSKAMVFDNMDIGKKDRSIKGTTAWQKYEIVLDVPDDAFALVYGALIVGNGQIWVDNFKFEIVDSNVPTTGINIDTSGGTQPPKNNEPINLDFEK